MNRVGATTIFLFLYLVAPVLDASTFFDPAPQIVDLELEEVSTQCAALDFTTGRPVWEMILPTHINEDSYLDFVMIAFCPNRDELHGIEHDGPAISYLVALVSDNAGAYTVATKSVFGEETPYIEHMPRKWVEEDFNGDERLDFALAVNWDDGRLNQHVPYQIVLMSSEGETIEVHRIPTPNALMAHAISLANNELGGLDILWSGYCCFDGGVFAYRYQDNEWVDVTSEYPNSETTDLGFGDFGTETRAIQVPGETSKKIVAMTQRDSAGNPIKGMGLWVKDETGWSLADDYGISVVGEVERYSFVTNGPEAIPVSNLNGRELIVDAFTQEGCVIEDNGKTYFMAQVSGTGLIGETTLDRNRVYGTEDSFAGEEFVSYSLFFDISGNEILNAGLEVIDEQVIENGNYFHCEDLNNDGLMDFAMRNLSNSWRDNFTKLQTPYIYLNNGKNGFNYVDYERDGIFENEFGEYEGLLKDVDGDGVLDLIRFAKNFGEGTNLMHIYAGLTELFIDSDFDGVSDSEDAFPLDEIESVDTDLDGVGNNADLDDDDDGVVDEEDAFPFDSTETLDSDADGIGDNADFDDDNDGFTDEQELADGTDPFNRFSCRQGCFSFDIDGNRQARALTDGLLVIRHLFGFTGDALATGAIAIDASRERAEDISALLSSVSSELDIDGNGETKALSDGLLLIRYLFGFTGEALITGAVGEGATRITSESVEAFIRERVPAED